MLNQRQMGIALEMIDAPDTLLSTSALAAEKKVSTRTIQTDLKTIGEVLSQEACIEFQTGRRGSGIHVLDPAGFEV